MKTVVSRIATGLAALACLLMLPLLGAGQAMTARDYFILGQAKYRINACEIAVKEFTHALELDKKYTNAYLGRALSYMCMEEYDLALADIAQAIRLAPNEPIYLSNRGRIKLEKGDLRGAEADYLSVLAVDSSSWEAWYGLGEISKMQGKPEQAEERFDKAVRFKPGNAVTLAHRAEMRLANGQPESARSDVRQALDTEPLYGEAWLILGQAQNELSEYGEALENYQRAAQLLPGDPRPHYHRGSTWMRINRSDSAIANFTQALDDDRKFSDAYYLRGLAYEQSGDVKGARKDFGKCLKQDPKNIEAWRHRAELYRAEGKLKDACKDYSSAIKNDSKDFSLVLERGFLYLELMDNQRSLADFNLVTKKEPENARAWYGLGEAKYREGNLKEACNDWRLAAEKGSEEAKTALKTFCIN